MEKNKKKSKMSPALKAFLKREGRFPKAGELKTRRVKASAKMKGGGSKRRRGSTGKKGKKNGKQGVVSWLVNIASLAILAANPIARVADAMKAPEGMKFKTFGRYMAQDYLGVALDPNTLSYVDFKAERVLRGWGMVGVAVGFKKGMGYATKSIKVKSLIPGS